MSRQRDTVKRDSEGFIILHRKIGWMTNSKNMISTLIGAHRLREIDPSKPIDKMTLEMKPATYYDMNIGEDSYLNSLYWLPKAWDDMKWSMKNISDRFNNDQWVCQLGTDKPMHITNVYSSYLIIVDGLPVVRIPEDGNKDVFQHLRNSGIFSSYLRICYSLWRITMNSHKRDMDKAGVYDRIRMIVTYDDMSFDVFDCPLNDAMTTMGLIPKPSPMDNKPWMWNGSMKPTKVKHN